MHGPDGLGGANLPCADLHHGHRSEKMLAEMVRTAPDEITLLALGPLTNVARFMERDPATAERIGQLVMMGGTLAGPGNVTPTAEYNIYCDPQAARAVGNPHLRIALRHIFPNIVPPILVQATLAIAAAIIAEASLSFLGLGQQPPAPSWGSMLNTAKNYIDHAPWMAVWPGLSIFVVVLAFNLLGDGLRDALDPKSR